jgi:hypothetical protein
MNRCICGVGKRGVLAVCLIPAAPVCFSKGNIESSMITRKPKPVAILQGLALLVGVGLIAASIVAAIQLRRADPAVAIDL